jgi:hypothetical protein
MVDLEGPPLHSTIGEIKWPWRSTGEKNLFNKKRKWNLQNSKGADTAAALLLQKIYHRKAALQ